MILTILIKLDTTTLKNTKDKLYKYLKKRIDYKVSGKLTSNNDSIIRNKLKNKLTC